MVDAQHALFFLDSMGRRLDAAWARFVLEGSGSDPVLDALSAYQNPDGGFGQALEPDIAAPVSQPFAVRMAMHVLLGVKISIDSPMVVQLNDWLERNQDDDGCWQLPPEIHDFPLAPWFGGWTFPSLNPALCLSGLASRLGIGSEEMQRRVRGLFDRLASLDEISGGGYYELLPYVEYVPWIAHPERDLYLRALAERITGLAMSGGYPDAGHFFGHLGPAGGPIARLVEAKVVSAQLERLAMEQGADGSWPNPYAPHWQSWATASALETLRDFERI